MSIYQNDYMAKAKRFIVTTEERDDLIAVTIDTYDKRTMVMSVQQVQTLWQELGKALDAQKGTPAHTGTGKSREPGDDDVDF